MSETNCPNCGAPKTGAVCEYCGTRFQKYVGGTARRVYQGETTVDVNSYGVDVYTLDGSLVAHISGTMSPVITVNEYSKTYGYTNV